MILLSTSSSFSKCSSNQKANFFWRKTSDWKTKPSRTAFLRFIVHGMLMVRPTTIPSCSVVIISCVILCKLMSHRTPRRFMWPSRCKDSVCGRQVSIDVFQYILLWVALAVVETSQLLLDRHLEVKYQAECRYDDSLLPRVPHASP